MSAELASQWHATLNKHLTPLADGVFLTSHTRVWWQCPNFQEHMWITRIVDRQGADLYEPYVLLTLALSAAACTGR